MFDCHEWRQIIRRSERPGAPRLGTVRQILRCVTVAVQRGARRQLQAADRYLWHWGAGADDLAVVMVDAAGRIAYATPGAGLTAWSDCAKAAA